MNDVKVFCPNCQEGVNTKAMTKSVGILGWIIHLVIFCCAVILVLFEIALFFLVIPAFFLGRTLSLVKSEAVILLTGEKSRVYVCEHCNVIL